MTQEKETERPPGDAPTYIPPPTILWWVERGAITKAHAALIDLYQFVVHKQREGKHCYVSIARLAKRWSVHRRNLEKAIADSGLLLRLGRKGQRGREWILDSDPRAAAIKELNAAAKSNAAKTPHHDGNINGCNIQCGEVAASQCGEVAASHNTGENQNKEYDIDTGGVGGTPPPDPIPPHGGNPLLQNSDPDCEREENGANEEANGRANEEANEGANNTAGDSFDGGCERGAKAPPPGVPAAPRPADAEEMREAFRRENEAEVAHLADQVDAAGGDPAVLPPDDMLVWHEWHVDYQLPTPTFKEIA
jgi:hypothetical protein